MVVAYPVPDWFVAYDIALGVTFAIITCVVSFYAFKVYFLSEQRQSKLLGFGFLFISLAYFIQSAVNFIILGKIYIPVPGAVVSLTEIYSLSALGLYAYIFFFTLGLITLTYITLNIRSIKLYSMLIMLVMLSLFLSYNVIYLFHLLSLVLLFYIIVHYFINYLAHRRPKTLLVLAAFFFLFLGSVDFAFSLSHGVFYVVGHFLELVAYVCILISLLMVVRR